MADFGLLSVFLVGLLGGVHCVGMCGGIVTAFSLRRDGQRPAFFVFSVLVGLPGLAMVWWLRRSIRALAQA